MRSLLLLLAWPATLAWQAHATPQSRRPLLPVRIPAQMLRPAEELQNQPPLLPLGVLMLVPVAWGTFGVAVKTIAKVGAPPPELAFSVMQYIVASSALGLLSSVSVPPAASKKATRAATAAAGFELGSYLFFGALLQLFGLGMTTATRGAFIVQLTTIIVPLMDAAVKRTAPSRLLLGACVLAFGGVMAFVKSVPAGLAMGTTMMGDGLIALAALLYSLHVVRLSHHAPRIPPIALARAKELTRLCLGTLVLLVGTAFVAPQRKALVLFVRSFSAAPVEAFTALAIVTWVGLVTTAFPTWGQSFGQASIDAGTATVIYTAQPLWSAAFGFALLGERLNGQSLAGAAAIFAAVALVAWDRVRNRPPSSRRLPPL